MSRTLAYCQIKKKTHTNQDFTSLSSIPSLSLSFLLGFPRCNWGKHTISNFAKMHFKRGGSQVYSQRAESHTTHTHDTQHIQKNHTLYPKSDCREEDNR